MVFPAAPLIPALDTTMASLSGRPESKPTEDATVTSALRVEAITSSSSVELEYECYEESQMRFVSDWFVSWAYSPLFSLVFSPASPSL